MQARDRNREFRLDDTDKRLIGLLEQDGRRTSKSLAEELGITEVTAASRIRRLSERGLAQVVGVLSLGSAGFNISVIFGVRAAEGVSARRIARSLSELDEVRGVSLVDAEFDLMGAFVVRDQDHLREMLQEKLQRIVGVEYFEYFEIVEPVVYKPEWALNIS